MLPPTPFEIELRETLERLGDLSLKLNDRVEEQTKVISHATTMANETRQAGEATKQQTDPDQYVEYAVEVIDKRIEALMQGIRQTASDLLKASSYTREVLSKADQDRTDAQRQLWEREQKLDRFKSRVSWFGCYRSGPRADGDATSFLSQLRFHMHCPWGVLDYDNHRRRCMRVLSAVSDDGTFSRLTRCRSTFVPSLASKRLPDAIRKTVIWRTGYFFHHLKHPRVDPDLGQSFLVIAAFF